MDWTTSISFYPVERSGKFITLLYPGESFQMIVEAEGYEPHVQYVDLTSAHNKGEAEDLIEDLKITLKAK